MHAHGRTQPKIAGGGAVRGSEGHPTDDDDLASEKGHMRRKKGTFFHDCRGQLPPPPAIATALGHAQPGGRLIVY